MPKISDEPMCDKLVTFFKSDVDYLNSLFKGHFGVNRVIRGIVRSYVLHAKAKAAESIDTSVRALDEAPEIPEEAWDRLLKDLAQ